jgi:hypothetical protein
MYFPWFDFKKKDKIRGEQNVKVIPILVLTFSLSGVYSALKNRNGDVMSLFVVSTCGGLRPRIVHMQIKSKSIVLSNFLHWFWPVTLQKARAPYNKKKKLTWTSWDCCILLYMLYIIIIIWGMQSIIITNAANCFLNKDFLGVLRSFFCHHVKNTVFQP